MGSIFWRSAGIALLSVAASVAISLTLVPLLGGKVSGLAWAMLTVCPLAVAWPASAHSLWQKECLRRALDDARLAHAELETAHRQLAEIHHQLREKSRRDHMTGMLNRETFFSSLEKSRRRSDGGVLLIIDADEFKLINDTHGHLTGDAALLEISAAIERAVRDGDILGRIGGEEFGAFLVGADLAEAAAVAERIRRQVERVEFAPAGGPTIPLTVSIGGTRQRPGATISDLMREADRRLYAAKRAGRNRANFGGGTARAA